VPVHESRIGHGHGHGHAYVKSYDHSGFTHERSALARRHS
jgi:hypothetical protein